MNSKLLKIWNIFLYVFGGTTALGAILSIKEDLDSSIFGILFGLSLFKVFYDIIYDKLKVDKQLLKIARVVLPIILLILLGLTAPEDIKDKIEPQKGNEPVLEENTNENESKKEEETTQKNEPEKSNTTTNEQQDEKVIFLKNTKANEYYKILCEVTGLKSNKAMDVFGDIIEYTSNNNNYLIEVGANKKSDEIAYVTITTINASDSTNAFMALTRLDYNGKNSGELTSFITKNMGSKAEKTIGDVKFSIWASNGKPIIKGEALDFEEYVENME